MNHLQCIKKRILAKDFRPLIEHVTPFNGTLRRELLWYLLKKTSEWNIFKILFLLSEIHYSVAAFLESEHPMFIVVNPDLSPGSSLTYCLDPRVQLKIALRDSEPDLDPNPD
jgi:hypothetical protein